MPREMSEEAGLEVRMTPQALAGILQARSQEIDSEAHDLWMELAESSNGKRQFHMYFRPSADAGPDDVIHSHEGISLVIPAQSVDLLTGGPTVFLTSTVVEAGFGLDDDDDDFEALDVMPSSPAVAAAGEMEPLADLTGDVAQRVMQILEKQINPSIAVHGGRADLVSVEDETAVLRLSGGCQGCGLASVTLSQGIEVAITDAVPEITKVVDATDHSAGANPFYDSSKK